MDHFSAAADGRSSLELAGLADYQEEEQPFLFNVIHGHPFDEQAADGHYDVDPSSQTTKQARSHFSKNMRVVDKQKLYKDGSVARNLKRLRAHDSPGDDTTDDDDVPVAIYVPVLIDPSVGGYGSVAAKKDRIMTWSVDRSSDNREIIIDRPGGNLLMWEFFLPKNTTLAGLADIIRNASGLPLSIPIVLGKMADEHGLQKLMDAIDGAKIRPATTFAVPPRATGAVVYDYVFSCKKEGSHLTHELKTAGKGRYVVKVNQDRCGLLSSQSAGTVQLSRSCGSLADSASALSLGASFIGPQSPWTFNMPPLTLPSHPKNSGMALGTRPPLGVGIGALSGALAVAPSSVQLIPPGSAAASMPCSSRAASSVAGPQSPYSDPSRGAAAHMPEDPSLRFTELENRGTAPLPPVFGVSDDGYSCGAVNPTSLGMGGGGAGVRSRFAVPMAAKASGASVAGVGEGAGDASGIGADGREIKAAYEAARKNSERPYLSLASRVKPVAAGARRIATTLAAAALEVRPASSAPIIKTAAEELEEGPLCPMVDAAFLAVRDVKKGSHEASIGITKEVYAFDDIPDKRRIGLLGGIVVKVDQRLKTSEKVIDVFENLFPCDPKFRKCFDAFSLLGQINHSNGTHRLLGKPNTVFTMAQTSFESHMACFGVKKGDAVWVDYNKVTRTPMYDRKHFKEKQVPGVHAVEGVCMKNATETRALTHCQLMATTEGSLPWKANNEMVQTKGHVTMAQRDLSKAVKDRCWILREKGLHNDHYRSPIMTVSPDLVISLYGPQAELWLTVTVDGSIEEDSVHSIKGFMLWVRNAIVKHTGSMEPLTYILDVGVEKDWRRLGCASEMLRWTVGYSSTLNLKDKHTSTRVLLFVACSGMVHAVERVAGEGKCVEVKEHDYEVLMDGWTVRRAAVSEEADL